MTFTLAPVSFSKSGARRCSGSAICGPVKVMMLMVTPSNSPASAGDCVSEVSAEPAKSALLIRLELTISSSLAFRLLISGFVGMSAFWWLTVICVSRFSSASFQAVTQVFA